MPERSEVKIYTDILQPFVGRKVVTAWIRKEDASDMEGQTVLRIASKGKFLWWELTSGCVYNELMMGGHWQLQRPHKPDASFVFDNGANVYYIDTDYRKLSKLAVVQRDVVDAKLAKLGPDLLDDHWSLVNLAISKRRCAVGALLLDQSVVSGVGNYIKCDALYLARVHPDTPWHLLTLAQQQDVLHQCVYVGMKSYLAGGRYGGGYDAYVYGRTEDAQGNPVVTIKTKDGRQSFVCPAVQIKKK